MDLANLPSLTSFEGGRRELNPLLPSHSRAYYHYTTSTIFNLVEDDIKTFSLETNVKRQLEKLSLIIAMGIPPKFSCHEI